MVEYIADGGRQNSPARAACLPSERNGINAANASKCGLSNAAESVMAIRFEPMSAGEIRKSTISGVSSISCWAFGLRLLKLYSVF